MENIEEHNEKSNNPTWFNFPDKTFVVFSAIAQAS